MFVFIAEYVAETLKNWFWMMANKDLVYKHHELYNIITALLGWNNLMQSFKNWSEREIEVEEKRI